MTTTKVASSLFQPSDNVAKMQAGIPLTDADRLNARIVADLQESGICVPSTTRIGDDLAGGQRGEAEVQIIDVRRVTRRDKERTQSDRGGEAEQEREEEPDEQVDAQRAKNSFGISLGPREDMAEKHHHNEPLKNVIQRTLSSAS